MGSFELPGTVGTLATVGEDVPLVMVGTDEPLTTDGAGLTPPDAGGKVFAAGGRADDSCNATSEQGLD